MARGDVSFIFELDGTLVDSVMAWQEGLQAEQIDISTCRIHRRIGMSGGLAAGMLLREVEVPISAALLDRLQARHSEVYAGLVRWVRPLPGALRLLEHLRRTEIPWAVATSGNMDVARHNLELLGIEPKRISVITRQDVKRANPDPDLFLYAAERLHLDITSAVIIGDSIRVMLAARRARGLSVGVLCQDELEWNVRGRSACTRIPRICCATDEVGGRT